MPTFSLDDISDALERPPGKRAIEPRLRENELRLVNYGDFVRISPSYLHHGVGGFAVVFRVRDSATGQEVALRCWTRSDPPQEAQARCAALNHYRQAHPLPYLVRQQYFDSALLVKDVYQPIILMDWVNGRTLRNAVGEACTSHRTDLLQALSIDFEAMVTSLQAQGIAHGDLQHENILVRSDGALCLVDYDSVFVPTMTPDEPSPVAGVAGYGHPDYVNGDVVRPQNALMDTFAAVVIAASLRVLAITPRYFDSNTTQNLLFTNDDIDDPQASLFMKTLQRDFSGHAEIMLLLAALLAMRADRTQAQVLFADLLDRRKKRPRIAPRIVPPNLPLRPAAPVWEKFAGPNFSLEEPVPPSSA